MIPIHSFDYYRVIFAEGVVVYKIFNPFTAVEGDTLWGLQQDTGRDWTTSDYTGDPRKLQMGQKVSFAAKNEPNQYKTVDSTSKARAHYYQGNGSPVNLGPHTIETLKTHPEQLRRQNRITSGVTPGPYSGDYGVDLGNSDGTYYVGGTAVLYSASYGKKFAVIDFTGFANDGFWDVWAPDGAPWTDGPGKNWELPGGKPYAFTPYRWTISVPNPRLQ